MVVALTASGAVSGTQGRLHEARSFYGTYRVLEDGGRHLLVHGTTVHGTEYTDAARRDLPTTYYARSGPLGDVFDRLGTRAEDVGVVGLGAGTVAAYGEPGQRMTFFEIDPEVVRIARDQRFFHYLADSPADVRTVTGDGRLALAREPRATYDLLVLDAFSSDAIPVHLMTQEAVALYASRLRPGGVLMFHISNRVFDLEPVLGAAAATAAPARGARDEQLPRAGRDPDRVGGHEPGRGDRRPARRRTAVAAAGARAPGRLDRRLLVRAVRPALGRLSGPQERRVV